MLIAVLIAASLAVFLLLRGRSDPLSHTPPLLNAKTEDLRATRVTATLADPIQPGSNLLWCGTFQLAWNEAAEFFGEDPNFAEEVPLAAALNRKEFVKLDLDEASYIAIGGLATDRTFDRILSEAHRKFGREFRTELVPPTNSNLGAFFYACLFKNLVFEKEFHRIKHPLLFRTNEVAAFGIEPGQPDSWRLRPQVRILDYHNTNDFVIELKTKSKADTLILAKVPPQKTLADTVNDVARRGGGQPSSGVDFLNLLIPKTDFTLTRTYEELLDKHLALKKAAQWNGYPIVLAKQSIRFRLDEKGAMLKSEAAVAALANISPDSLVDLVFDRPFLVLMQRVGASAPYFALWIDNAELLVPWNSKLNSPGADLGRQ